MEREEDAPKDDRRFGFRLFLVSVPMSFAAQFSNQETKKGTRIMKSEIETRSPVRGQAIRYTATFASGQLERLKELASLRRHSVSQVIRELVEEALAAHEREVLTQKLADILEEAWENWPGCDNSFAREAYHLADKFLSDHGHFVVRSWPRNEEFFRSSRDFAERVMARAITQSEAVGP